MNLFVANPLPPFGYADRIQEVHIKVIHIFMLLIEGRVG
jgi:D-sedoheptulose 7-phosphate isomerase